MGHKKSAANFLCRSTTDMPTQPSLRCVMQQIPPPYDYFMPLKASKQNYATLACNVGIESLRWFCCLHALLIARHNN
jgi:hypothetical protein